MAGRKIDKRVRIMPLRRAAQNRTLREALKRGRYKSYKELSGVTGMSFYELRETIKRCNYEDIFDKSNDIDRFEQIFKLFPEANSMAEMARKMGMTRQRVEQYLNHAGIKDVLKAYFQLKKLNKTLRPVGDQSFEDILISSQSFKEVVSNFEGYKGVVMKAFAVMFGDKWDMIKDILFEYWGWNSKNRKCIQYWLDKRKTEVTNAEDSIGGQVTTRQTN